MRDRGSAAVDFVLVALPLLVLLLAVLQGAAFLHLRAVVVASAAEGARQAAVADRSTADGGPLAEQVLARGGSARAADRIRCAAAEVPGPAGAVLVAVRCRGTIPALLAPALPVDITAHALKEGR